MKRYLTDMDKQEDDLAKCHKQMQALEDQVQQAEGEREQARRLVKNAAGALLQELARL